MVALVEDAPPEGCHHYGYYDEVPEEINKLVYHLSLITELTLKDIGNNVMISSLFTTRVYGLPTSPGTALHRNPSQSTLDSKKHLALSNYLKHDCNIHRRSRASRKDHHYRCVCWHRRQYHCVRLVRSLGPDLRHRKRSQGTEMRQAQCRNIWRFQKDMVD